MVQVWGAVGKPDFSVDRWRAATCDLHMTPKYLAERRCINFLYIMQDVLPKSLFILSLPISVYQLTALRSTNPGQSCPAKPICTPTSGLHPRARTSSLIPGKVSIGT